MNPFNQTGWYSVAMIISLSSACVPASRYHKAERSNQDAQKKIQELSLRAERADSLSRELEASQKALFKTERTLADFYIEYKIREDSNPSVLPDSSGKMDPTGEKKELKQATAGSRKQTDSLSYYKNQYLESTQKLKVSENQLKQKTAEIEEIKKRFKARDEVFDTQEKRLSDFFTALYKQRVAYDSLQAEYYALYKSRDQKNQSSKIDPQETYKLKRALASRDSLIYRHQRTIEEKEYKIKSLQSLSDSLMETSGKNAFKENAEKLQKENQDLVVEIQSLKNANLELTRSIGQKEQIIETQNREVGSLKSELSNLQNEKKEKKTESQDLKKLKAENEKWMASSQRQSAELDSAKSQLQRLKGTQSTLVAENENLRTEIASKNADLEKMKKEISDLKETNTRQNSSTQELSQLNAKNEMLKSEIQSLKRQQDSLLSQSKSTTETARSEKKLDSLRQELKVKSDQLSAREREIKTLQLRVDDLTAQAKAASGPALNPGPPPAGISKLQEQLKKLGSDQVVIQPETTGAILEIPQSALFTPDLITLTQKGSELIIRICQNIQTIPAKSLEILSVQNASMSKNDNVELLYGRAKTIGKLMNIYGVKSDEFSFGIKPGGNSENIRIRIAVK